MRFCIFLFLGVSLVTLTRASNRDSLRSQQDLPVLTVKLVPPKKPFPEVADHVRHLNIAREERETILRGNLLLAYNAERVRASAKIKEMVSEVLGQPKTSFLQRRPQQDRQPSEASFQVKVSLTQVAQPDPSVEAVIDAMESKRSTLEEDLFKQARAEMSGLTSLVLEQLSQSLAQRIKGPSPRRGATIAFLEHVAMQPYSKNMHGSLQQANVRIQASSSAFPRVSDLIQEMQANRDQAENKERRDILDLELRLLQAENELISSALASYH